MTGRDHNAAIHSLPRILISKGRIIHFFSTAQAYVINIDTRILQTLRDRRRQFITR